MLPGHSSGCLPLLQLVRSASRDVRDAHGSPAAAIALLDDARVAETGGKRRPQLSRPAAERAGVEHERESERLRESGS